MNVEKGSFTYELFLFQMHLFNKTQDNFASRVLCISDKQSGSWRVHYISHIKQFCSSFMRWQHLFTLFYITVKFSFCCCLKSDSVLIPKGPPEDKHALSFLQGYSVKSLIKTNFLMQSCHICSSLDISIQFAKCPRIAGLKYVQMFQMILKEI